MSEALLPQHFVDRPMVTEAELSGVSEVVAGRRRLTRGCRSVSRQKLLGAFHAQHASLVQEVVLGLQRGDTSVLRGNEFEEGFEFRGSDRDHCHGMPPKLASGASGAARLEAPAICACSRFIASYMP